MIENTYPDLVNEAYDTAEILKLAGIKDEQDTDELTKEEEKVSDSDNDGKGYKYCSDAYTIFGGEKQKVHYVPARSGDNALAEGKSFKDYLKETENNIFESYLGSCVDIGSDDNSPYEDATVFAQAIDNDYKEIQLNEFLKLSNLTSDQLSNFGNIGDMIFYIDEKNNIKVAYNEQTDVHYFFE